MEEVLSQKDRDYLNKIIQIEALKMRLGESDYKAIKYAEGWISEEAYAPIKAERQALRNQINELEGSVV